FPIPMIHGIGTIGIEFFSLLYLSFSSLHASAAPTANNQYNNCRWGRFAGYSSEPDWNDGPFTVSVLLDRPPKVVYPRIPNS
ncbi:hypothetical protein PRIPAC_75998, partial [Pristionchus pacificus]